MIIIPLEKSIDWKRPPLVTLFLILTCSAILFGVEHYENRKYAGLFDFYFASGLPRLELSSYAVTLYDEGEDIDPKSLQQLLNTDYRQLDEPRRHFLQGMLLHMQHNAGFMERLHHGEIVTADNDEFRHWQVQRKRFEALTFDPVNKTYGFTPKEHKPLTFLTHMFLHGGIGHLFGNMLFLFLVGFTVEMALGSTVYLLCYLLTGLAAVSLFWAVNPASEVPLVGASGAISGLMGLYAGIFGLRKIRFFYSLLFYFDYVRAPALIMLPAWLANEFYQMLTMPDSNVAFIAHIGGLSSGGLLAVLLQRFSSASIDTAYLDAAKRDEDKQQRYRQAMQFLGAMNIPKAQKTFQELHAEYPDDRNILWQLYNALKHDPNSTEFYRILVKILSLNDIDAQTLKQLNDAFGYYLKAQPGKIALESARLRHLAILFAKYGYPENAEKIVLTLLRSNPELADLDKVLFAVAVAWQKRSNRTKCAETVTLLQKYFPKSQMLYQAQLVVSANEF
ncbi:rhomboid family intramembrane serine protease [Methylobacter sp. YRD-M1]|uniref:rhomboid family intramembrane serine protease n=1 Tax=Methylobacter sp. YRD-M1 TaxID=2911520 RepID=UPI00227B76E8|nr:rhomboid family intramembrane serine protease [Methylobacter sp. YRD-M1]WAK03609.1 rhomboid family intramembrane serine protease [Methylobacter sp. YRD-M1]